MKKQTQQQAFEHSKTLIRRVHKNQYPYQKQKSVTSNN